MDTTPAPEKAPRPSSDSPPVATGPGVPPDDPRLLPFLPLLYIAWADGELEPGEIRRIHKEVEEAGLGGEWKPALLPWLDPETSPGPRDLQSLLATLRRLAREVPDAERKTVRELALGLTQRGGRAITDDEIGALGLLEDALGIPGHSPSRRLLRPARPTEGEALPAPEAEVPTFDVDAMTRFLDGSGHELQAELRRLLAAPPLLWERSRDHHVYREEVLERLRYLAARGYGTLSFPEEHGGEDNTRAFVTTFETLAYGDLSLLVKFGVQFGLFAGALHQLGTDYHHRTFLEPAMRLALPGCFAMTETGHGSNVQDLATTAVWDPNRKGFVIHTPDRDAFKDYIGNAAAHGRAAVVFAQLEVGEESHGVHALVVPIRDQGGRPLPGVHIEDCGYKMGLNGVDNGRLAFDQVFVPRENLLDRFATVSEEGVYASPIASPGKRFFTMLGTLVGGRVSVALAGNSAAKSALAIAVRYGDRRRQFGPEGAREVRILDYRSHQLRLLPRLATSYALHFALRQLADDYARALAEDGDRRELEAEAAGLKAYSTWHATDTIQEGREACGGQGYLAVNRFAALKEDTDVFTTFEGDNTVLLQLVAKSLLTGYGKQFGSMSLFGQARHLAVQAGRSLKDHNPVVARRTGEDHLLGRDFQLAALNWREYQLLTSAAGRMRSRIKGGQDPFEALNDCQDHLLAMARASVERLILERFLAGVDACEDESLKPVLSKLVDLWALSRIRADSGWFLAHGHIESKKAKAIRDLILQLCRELRPVAVPLVDAFGIPEELMPPIAERVDG